MKVRLLVRQAREEKGLNQQQLAKLSGVSQQTISKVEATGSTTVDTLFNLAIGLGCRMEDLYEAYDDEEEERNDEA